MEGNHTDLAVRTDKALIATKAEHGGDERKHGEESVDKDERSDKLETGAKAGSQYLSVLPFLPTTVFTVLLDIRYCGPSKYLAL
jgi:hypothetical protein